MKVALVYDRINKWGGAERVLLALHELFPDAPLYTSVYDAASAPWAHVFTIRTSFLQRFHFARRHHEWFAWLMPLVFESFNFDEFDLVISVTSADAKGIITRPHTKHICYCLTPTRYLWSHYAIYFANPVDKVLSAAFVAYLRYWDKIASKRPDHYIAISQTVRERIKTYYHQDSSVVFPPIAKLPPTKTIPVSSKNIPDNFFLVVSRLVAYKRIDIAIHACNTLQLPLVIVGSGSDKARLYALSGSTIYFRENLTDPELTWYYQHSQALIMPQDEDLGLVSLEAQQMGTPVIAYREGGACETVQNNTTGVFFYPQTKEALQEVLVSFNKKDYNAETLKHHSNSFTIDQFKKNMTRTLSRLIETR